MSVTRVYPVSNFSRFFEARVRPWGVRFHAAKPRSPSFRQDLGNWPQSGFKDGPAILKRGASMNSKRSYLDTLNAGRQRRPHTTLEQLNRSLETLEQRLERTREETAAPSDPRRPAEEPRY